MKNSIMFVLLASCVGANAQEFKEGLIFDLRGPVKEVWMDNEMYGISRMGFTPDGKCTPSAMRFDDDGCPLGLSISLRNTPNGEERTFSLTVEYDSQGRLSSTTSHVPMGIYAGTETRTYLYGTEPGSTDTVRSMTVDASDNDGETRTEYLFADYEYDDHGNWISRRVERSISWPDNPERNASSKFIEKRTVTYYD